MKNTDKKIIDCTSWLCIREYFCPSEGYLPLHMKQSRVRPSLDGLYRSSNRRVYAGLCVHPFLSFPQHICHLSSRPFHHTMWPINGAYMHAACGSSFIVLICFVFFLTCSHSPFNSQLHWHFYIQTNFRFGTVTFSPAKKKQMYIIITRLYCRRGQQYGKWNWLRVYLFHIVAHKCSVNWCFSMEQCVLSQHIYSMTKIDDEQIQISMVGYQSSLQCLSIDVNFFVFFVEWSEWVLRNESAAKLEWSNVCCVRLFRIHWKPICRISMPIDVLLIL